MAIITQILIALAAIVFTIFLNSLMEWFVHGPMMHGKLAAFFHLEKSHREHHAMYGGEDPYANELHGQSVALPMWSFFITVGVMALIGWGLAHLLGYFILSVYIVVVSSVYYIFYQYIHTSMHIPKGRWIEKTRWFDHKNAYHKAHHLVDADFHDLINICILCPWADMLLGTTMQRRLQKQKLGKNLPQ